MKFREYVLNENESSDDDEYGPEHAMHVDHAHDVDDVSPEEKAQQEADSEKKLLDSGEVKDKDGKVLKLGDKFKYNTGGAGFKNVQLVPVEVNGTKRIEVQFEDGVKHLLGDWYWEGDRKDIEKIEA